MAVFSDIDLEMGIHPLNRDIVKKYDEAAISRSIQNIINTNKYEKAFNPMYGGNLRALLFEPTSNITKHSLKTTLEFLIRKYEKRVKNVRVDVEVSPDESSFECDVQFTAINNREPTKITLYLKRVR